MPTNQGAIPPQIIDTITQITSLMGPIGAIVATVINATRAIKAAWPDAPVEDPDVLFARLMQSAQLGEAETKALRAHLRTLPGWEEPA
jgi:hypothetical protein